MDNDSMKNDVASPTIDMEYRPVPFWSWNDELEADELVRQIHDMHDAGMGGFFMHARTGLKTPYMGKKWMDAISICVREAAKLDMQAWLYDENGWPSGFAAGAVNALGEDYWQKTLRFTDVEKIPDEARNRRIVAWYDASSNLLSSEDGAALAAWYEVNRFYVDNMSPLVTGTFIEKTHEIYWKELPEDVKKNLAGIFTDEPQLADSGVQWSLIMPEEYQTAYGESLLKRIPELFRETAECHRTRIRYYRLCTQLFRKNYICRLGKWCEAHGWKLTGHNVMEEMLHGQVYTSGAVMPQYTGYSIPGIDHLDRFSPYITSEIQVASVAAQTGKRQILTETFGCTGWNFNMQGMKWLYQQQLAHGVNLLCQHLAGYSLHGLRKRDYPASLSYQHPMWLHVRSLHDSFSRVGRMLATGNIECDTLILHGISSAWADAIGDNEFTGIAQRCYNELATISTLLDNNAIPFHYGDEILMEEMAAVEGKKLRIGHMRYTMALMPPMYNISGKVLAMLKELHANGGIILSHSDNSELLTLVDGMPLPDSDKAFLSSLQTYATDELPALLSSRTKQIRIRKINGQDTKFHGIWRAFPSRGERWYFIIDTGAVPSKKANDPICQWQYLQGPDSNEASSDIEVRLPFPARSVRLIDQADGHVIRELDTVSEEGLPRFLFHLPSCGSILLQAKDAPQVGTEIDLTGGWSWAGDNNVLTLDKACYRSAEQTAFSPETDVLAIFNRLLALPDTDIAVRYSFSCSDSLDFCNASLRIALEPAPGAEYYLNGTPLKPDFNGWFIDRSIRILPLPASLLRHGVNHFEMRFHFAQSPDIRASLEKAKHFESEANKLFFDSELESVYLLGRFSCGNNEAPDGHKELFGRYVNPPFELSSAPTSIDASALIYNGFTFFSGNLTLTRSITLSAEQATLLSTLKMTPFRADSVTFSVNGTQLPTVFTAPYEISVEGLLKEGINTLTMTLGVAPRNTLGPLHSMPAEPDGTRITSFLTEQDFIGRHPKPMTELYSLLEPGTHITLV